MKKICQSTWWEKADLSARIIFKLYVPQRPRIADGGVLE